ncbi:methyltransferase, partial [Streptomyces sp. TRM76130]|nr:methyltransferase [Streptomyces sp. TRM76130]
RPAETPCSDLTAFVGRRRAERTGCHVHEDWRSWWSEAARDPELADLCTERERRRPAGGGSTGAGDLSLDRHIELLRRAGFRYVTPVWQFGDSRVLVAVKGEG